MRLTTSAAKPCCVASSDIAHRLYKASNIIGRNDVCTHGGSFVCERQFQNIFGMRATAKTFGNAKLYTII
jgi:hypothetical protein